MPDSPGKDPDPRLQVRLLTSIDTTDTDTADTHDTAYDLSSTKCLGTFATMASPTAPSPPAPAESRPLNPNVYRPVTPPDASPSPSSGAGGDPRVFAKFPLSAVAVLRSVAVVFAVTLIVLEFDGRRSYNGLAKLFIFLAFVQLAWLLFALCSDCARRRGGGRRKGFTVDLGFVKCIFGRRGYEDEDGESDVLLGWAAPEKKCSGKRGMLFTAVDLAFAALALTTGLYANGDPYCWLWEAEMSIAAMCYVLVALEVLIAVAQQFAILKHARVRILYDDDEDEDDLGSHKYRIRLPQSPEQRHATMSFAAQ